MKIVNKFQAGGAMPAPAPEAAPAQDPIMQIVEMFSMGLQNQDCQLLAEGASLFMDLVAASSTQPPIGAENQNPIFRRGGAIKRK